MACKCVDRQRWLVAKLCAHGLTKLCQRAQKRLARMEEIYK
jgi:hypothetical protein